MPDYTSSARHELSAVYFVLLAIFGITVSCYKGEEVYIQSKCGADFCRFVIESQTYMKLHVMAFTREINEQV